MLFWALAGTLVACDGSSARRVRVKPPPSESYAQALERSGLTRRTVGRRWLAAARRAVEEAPLIVAPHEELVAFQENAPDARGWRLMLQRGQRLSVTLRGQNGQGQTFVDVLAVYGSTRQSYPLQRAESGTETSTKTTLHFDFEARRDGEYVVRLQPEIFAFGVWNLSLALGTSLGFPVEGRDEKAIQSRFGAPRDGGRRLHQGVDIFAPKGTPVRAAVEGPVFYRGVDRLGGNVVWQWDPNRRLRIYYAHLDDWAVRKGQQLARGAVVGWVGNTGNAVHTPSHLHFGIYDPRPIDPSPFLAVPEPPPPRPPAGTLPLAAWARVRPRRQALLEGPAPGAPSRRLLSRHTAVMVISTLAGGHQVELADGTRGFVPTRGLEGAAVPLRYLQPGPLTLYPRPVEGAVTTSTLSPIARAVLAEFDDYSLIDFEGQDAWVRRPG